MVTRPAILSHFRKTDPRIASVFERIALEDIVPEKPAVYFASLCEAIIGQQLSGAVADVIYARFEALFPGKRVTPAVLAGISDDALRSVGMSWSKVRFIRDLTAKTESGALVLSDLVDLPDDEVITRLTTIHGIGPWTAEMFLIFTLGRPDVFSFGDLGLKRAITDLYGLRKDPSVRKMTQLSRKWMPYRSYAARILWKYKDGQ